MYTINITVGTPAQQIMAVLDTGSPFLIIGNTESDFCSQDSHPCEIFQTYDPTQSTSAVWISDDMAVNYEITQDRGSWFNDTVTLGDLTIQNFPLGTANGSETRDAMNWFGLNGPGRSGSAPDSTLLGIMAQAGVIGSASISMFIGSLGSSSGELAFGALDTSKWQGDLQVSKIEESEAGTILASLKSVTVGDSKIESSNYPVKVSVDTGNFDIKLPQDIVDEIWSQVGGIQAFNVTAGDGSLPFGICDCSLAQGSQTFAFGFDDISIEVPMSDLVLVPPQVILEILGVTDFPSDTCVFMINSLGPSSRSDLDIPFILGDAFLRNAYFVLDWDSKEIALGQANNDGGDRNLIPIAAGESGLRDAVGGASGSSPSAAPSSQPSATGAGEGAAPTASSASPAGSSTPPSNSASTVSFGQEILYSGLLILLSLFM